MRRCSSLNAPPDLTLCPAQHPTSYVLSCSLEVPFPCNSPTKTRRLAFRVRLRVSLQLPGRANGRRPPPPMRIVLRVFEAPGKSNTNPSPCSRYNASMPHCLCPTFYSTLPLIYDAESQSYMYKLRRQPRLASCYPCQVDEFQQDPSILEQTFRNHPLRCAAVTVGRSNNMAAHLAFRLTGPLRQPTRASTTDDLPDGPVVGCKTLRWLMLQ
jgi:hypothetical protein